MEDDDFVRFGKPLPNFEGEDDQGKKQLISKTRYQKISEPTQYKHDLRVSDQNVLDAQGRRRFHGAFTGGYSAGYYNTVGSETGWKANNFGKFDPKNHTQCVEDFLDDEDRSEFGILPKHLKANAKFDPKFGRRGAVGTKYAPAPAQGYSHAVAGNIDTSATMGVRILRTMGFIEGKGNNLTHIDSAAVVKRKLILAKTENNVQLSLKLLEEQLQIRDSLHLKNFAKDYELPKSNNLTFGIGYKQLSGLLPSKYGTSNSGISKSQTAKTSKEVALFGQNKKISGGFGVGAFEEEDADIYGDENMNNYDIDLTIKSARKLDRMVEEENENNDFSLLALGYSLWVGQF